MDSAVDKLEFKGRMWLWDTALSQVHNLLSLASRAREGSQQENLKKELDSYYEKLNEYCESQQDYKEGVRNMSHVDKFNSTCHRDFPVLVECSLIRDACIELAIVYFCQVLNPGYGASGSAASNSRDFISEHLNALITKISSSSTEIDRVHSLCGDLLTARNKMLGHADAEQYDIKHGGQISTMMLPRHSWQNIGIDYWHEVVVRLQQTIHDYIKERNAL